jgi:hypothetical protein
MTTAAAANPSIELLRHLTPAQLASYDDETIRRIASYLRNSEYDRIDSLCGQEVASFEAGMLLWGTKYTQTENPQHEAQGVPFRAPFPRKSYFIPLFQEFLAKHACLFIPKSRTVMTSWAAMLFSSARAQWNKEEIVVQTANEDKCAHLIDYVRQLWDNQEDWLKLRHPLVRRTTFAIAWAGGGEVASIPSGADKIRTFHPTWYIQDESAHIPEGEECLSAVKPSGARIICISSAAPGWFAYECSQ